MKEEKILREAGLAGNEAKVYLALLDLGSVTAGEIAKTSGVNRTNVYDALRTLSEKGLVSHTKKSERRHFEAALPHKFIHYLEEKEEEARERRQKIEDVLPELEMKRKLSREQQEATVYTGKKGLRTVAEDVLRTGEEILIFGAEGEFTNIFRNYSRNWQRRRAQSRVPLKIIYSEKLRKEKSKQQIPLAEMRFHGNIYDTPETTWIYGDKVAAIVWSDHPIVTVIRSEKAARSYTQFFRELWRSSRGPAVNI